MDALVRAFAFDNDGVVVAADGGDVVDGGDGGAGDGDASDSDNGTSDASGVGQEDVVSDMSD